MDDKGKGELNPTHYTNFLTYLHSKKEDGILKKMILDVCFREESQKLNGVSESIFNQAEDTPIIKKIKNIIVGQGPKYPEKSYKLDVGEHIKYERLFDEFKKRKADMLYTNEILSSLGKSNLQRAMKWIRANYNRSEGFFSQTNFQRVPRDACRVSILGICSEINKELCSRPANPSGLITLMYCLREGVAMLEKTDRHRKQAAIFLRHTLKCATKLLTELGVLGLFEDWLSSIENTEATFTFSEEIIAAHGLSLGIVDIEDVTKMHQFREINPHDWVMPLFEPQQPQHQYKDNLEKFKNALQIPIKVHLKVFNRQDFSPEDFTQEEIKAFGFDIRSLQ